MQIRSSSIRTDLLHALRVTLLRNYIVEIQVTDFFSFNEGATNIGIRRNEVGVRDRDRAKCKSKSVAKR